MWSVAVILTLNLIGIAQGQFGFPYFGNQQQQPQSQGGGGFHFPLQQSNQNFGFMQPQNFGGYQPNNQNFYYPQNQHNYNQQNNNHQHQHRPQNNNQRPQNQQNNFVHTTRYPSSVQQQVTTPYVAFTTSRPVQQTVPFRVDGRISQRKCDEYSKLINTKVQFASLSLGSAAQDILLTSCDAVTGLIVGGTNAGPNEFPHQAAIGYPNFNGEMEFKCGGSLISELFVLTAAHCEKADRTSPTTVRLGDLNIKDRDVGLPEVDIPIETFISHEAYNTETKENDIAVVKMRQAPTFSKSIRPACLQQTENIGKTKAVATGWGYTEVGGPKADILQKVQLDIVPNQQCATIFNDQQNYNIFNSQICAGVLTGGKDTCNGDSGGPLQTTIGNQCVFSLIGLTSYGSAYCGVKNSPGVYTRVSAYLDWIENNVWS